MPRPHKCRRIGFIPDFYIFKPAGVEGKNLDEIVITIDEFEAIRLADYEEMYQEKAAEKMNISRQTFGNLINSAHKKVAIALIEGKMLRIDKGKDSVNYLRKFNCNECKYEWILDFGDTKSDECPKCKNTNINKKIENISTSSESCMHNNKHRKRFGKNQKV